MVINDTEIHGLKRFAVMGGTFDPIHLGHLAAAEEVRSYFDLEKVIFIPSGNPPHKVGTQGCSKKHRFLMTSLATNSNPYFEVSGIEMDGDGESYTVDTLTEIRKKSSKSAKIFFIIGADSLIDLPNWKNPDRLFELCEFITVSRNYQYSKYSTNSTPIISSDEAEVLYGLDRINDLYGVRPHFLRIPGLAISSTEIRNRIGLNRPVKYLLPGKVHKYIKKHGLYRNQSIKSGGDFHDIINIKKQVRRMISEKRYMHTIGVAEEAVKLAETYGEDINRAYTAALLHDCAKEAAKHECKYKEYGLDPSEISSAGLAHALLGEKIAEKDFNISDEEILAAIRHHTTGRVRMGVLEKIVFVADLIEPNREPYPLHDEICNTAHKNLDAAVLLGLRIKFHHICASGQDLHPDTIKAMNYYSDSPDYSDYPEMEELYEK